MTFVYSLFSILKFSVFVLSFEYLWEYQSNVSQEAVSGSTSTGTEVNAGWDIGKHTLIYRC